MLKLLKPHICYYKNERISKFRDSSLKDDGYSRDIFYNKEYIFKIEKLDTSLYQCKNEYDLWNTIKGSKESKFFIPTLEYGKTRSYYWCKQVREKFIETYTHHKDEKEFESVLKAFGIDIDVESSTRFHNCAVTIDGRLVCYDYGYISR